MAKKQKALFIFVTSDRPDVYINAICYCAEHYDLKRVVYLGITKDKIQQKNEEEYLKRVRSKVKELLVNLSNGKYLYWDKDEKKMKIKEIEVSNHDKKRYGEISELEPETEVLIYGELEAKIKEFVKASGESCIFDVSAISKSYLVDIYTILLSQGTGDIYTFDLKKKPEFDETDLIHRLSIDQGHYDYVKVTESSYTLGTAIKTKKDIENLRKIDEVAESIWFSKNSGGRFHIL